MPCLICLEDTDNKIITKCNCKLSCHNYCFNYFLKKSNFYCPICRIKKNNTRLHLINIIFRLPPSFALIIWFIISILFCIFIFPFLMMKEIYGNRITFIVYTIIIYMIKMTLIVYPMLITQFCVLCLYYFDISVL